MSSTSPTGSLSGMSMSYTALIATLVLLLAVSSAIVVRSLVLRRRHQRIVEEAIRAGTWLPHQAYDPRSSRRRRDIGKKPKMWEAWLRSDHGGGDSKCAWNDIIPIHAAYNNATPQFTTEESAQTQTDVQSRTIRLLRPFHRRSSSLVSPNVASMPASSSPSTSASPAVRVAVLIAMPIPPQQRSREMDGPPLVELGVVELPLRDTCLSEQQ
ncbi:hypothetical protein M405DRAFT_834984 [Rhizopogon salebrosus TDB-379]|nr:hypothetical protein M405DRAFT_834984 [Rhizopogon salebrosus TDB-379]